MAVTGIIRPPPDIRAVADKTALFVAKNGRSFEQRILNSGKGQTPKFAFLHDNSPFHAYYEDKIQFYSDGGTDETEEEKEAAAAASKKEGAGKKGDHQPIVIKKAAVQAENKSALDPIAKALLSQRNNIRAQYDEVEKTKKEASKKDHATTTTAEAPTTPVLVTPPARLHYINITAPSNLTPSQVETIKLVAQFIALDESKNFLQNLTIREWNNPTFAFLQPRHPHFAYFSALTDCYKYIISTALLKKDGFQTQSLQDCLNLAAYRSEYERDAQERNQGKNTDEEDLANAIDWHDFVLVETIDFAKDETVQPLVMPTAIEEGGMDVSDDDDDDDDDEMIRVVPNYTPKVVASSQTSKSQTHVIDPITGKSVPASQTSEHMRIQLLDPKWAEEKRKFQEKQKETNLVAGDMMATNLSRVVGDAPTTVGLHADPRRRLEEANRIIREQGRQQQPGPMLPPAAKRPRLSDPRNFPPGIQPCMPPPPLPLGMPPPGMPPPNMPPPGMPPGMPPPSMPPAPIAMPPQGMPPAPIAMPPPGMPAAPISMPPPRPFDPMAPPPPSAEEEAVDEILSEEDFAASLESPIVALEIAIPHDPDSMAWNFYGQTVSLKVDVMTKIKVIKEELSGHLNKIATNKLQLKHSTQSFLKDNMTLATLNLGPLVSLEMVPKTRGKRR